MTNDQIKTIEEFNRNVRYLRSKDRPHWVKGSVIQEVTGWDNKRLTKARKDGSVVSRKKEKSYEYDLNSLHKFLLK